MIQLGCIWIDGYWQLYQNNNVPSGVLTTVKRTYFRLLYFCLKLWHIFETKFSNWRVLCGGYGIYCQAFRHQQHILKVKSNNLKQFKGNLRQTAPGAFRWVFFNVCTKLASKF